jgi:hypothetical protein
LRLCDRYIDEAVLAFHLCPWAEPALRAGRVGRAVLTQAAPAPTDCLPVIDRWSAAVAPAVEVGLLILPRYAADRAAFDAFAERVRRADRARLPVGAHPVFMVAAFHPVGADRFTGPHQLVSFLRRAPDPFLQLVRADLLDRVKTAQPTASDEITERNHDALQAGGEASRFDAVVRAIRADRDATYARLGLGAGGEHGDAAPSSA